MLMLIKAAIIVFFVVPIIVVSIGAMIALDKMKYEEESK